MNILITGVSGYIGSYLFNNLKFKNIYGIYYRSKNKNFHKKKNIFKINLLKEIKLRKKLNFDFIVHCASKSPYHKENKKNYTENIKLTSNLIKFTKKKNIKNIIFMSSNSLYEKVNSLKITEKTEVKNIGLYAKSKKYSEDLLLNFAKKEKKNVIILRLPAIVGPNSKHTFLSKLYHNITYKKKFKIYNMNQRYNNVIDIKSLTTVVQRIVDLKINSGVYNIASIKPIKIKEIVKILAKGKPIFYKDLKLKIKSFVIEVNKIKKKGITLPSVRKSITYYRNV